MRRVLLFAAFLLLLGLSTAFAASFDVKAEDITSFSTPVSISVPTSVALNTYYVRGDTNPGALSGNGTAGGSTESTKFEVSPPNADGARGVTAPPPKQNEVYYFVWKSTSLDFPLSIVNKEAKFYVFQNGGSGAVSVALLDCPAGAPTASSTCVRIVPEVSAVPAAADGLISLGVVNYTTAPLLASEGQRELRLKVANFSASSWNLQWGFKNNRDSRLLFVTP